MYMQSFLSKHVFPELQMVNHINANNITGEVERKARMAYSDFFMSQEDPRRIVKFSYQQNITDDTYSFPKLTWNRPSVNA